MSDSQLSTIQKLVLDKFPYPVSYYYEEVLSTTDWQKNTFRLNSLFDYMVRLCSIVLLSQYLKVDAEKVSNLEINKILRNLSQPTLGTWVEILFSLAKIYYEHEEIELFVPEFRDLLANSGKSRTIFNQFVVLRNDLVHRFSPESDREWEEKFNQFHEVLVNVFEALSFISNYRLLLDLSDDKISYINNRGALEIIKENPDILIGTTYLKNLDNNLLELSPLVVAVHTDNSIIDFALLGGWTRSSVEYISYFARKSIRIQEESFLERLSIIPQYKSVRKPKVFISYAKQDSSFSNQILEFFTSINCQVWIDKINLLPGQDWEYEIRKAIDESDYFVACLSSKSVSKIGFIQKELKLALSVLEKFPEGKVFIVPIRLDECQVPSQLAKYHYVDWFAENAKELLRKVIAQ